MISRLSFLFLFLVSYVSVVHAAALDSMRQGYSFGSIHNRSYSGSDNCGVFSNNSESETGTCYSGDSDRLFERRTPTTPQDTRPTPAPTGKPSSLTTVHINDQNDFSLLMPKDGELISDAENDGTSFCSQASKESSCSGRLSSQFVRAAAVSRADDDSWIQITGCMDSSKYPFAKSDDGGQFDVRFPNGAQCSFGGYAASFIEQIEPSANRFCLRCCASPNDQVNCNSHQDRDGCPVAIPGTYDFPDVGVTCS